MPLVRFVDPTLAHEMAQYVTMHALIIHRQQRFFDAAQAEGVWRQRMLMQRAARQTRIGILGLGEIGGKIAERLALFGFPVSGWSRTRKNIPGVKSFAGQDELRAVPGAMRYPGLRAAADTGDRGILDSGFLRATAERRLGDQCGARRPC